MKTTSTSSSASGLAFNGAESWAAPWSIPAGAAVQRQNKAGYLQVTYTWTAGSWRYEARWHERVPSARLITYPSWRLDRTRPGNGYGPHAAPRLAQTWTGHQWLPQRQVRYLIRVANHHPSAAANRFLRAVHPAAIVTYLPEKRATRAHSAMAR